jgi:hypothetical protein
MSPPGAGTTAYAHSRSPSWGCVAGIAPTVDRPGYRRMVGAPRPSTAIPWARASIETRLGTASVDWRMSGDDLELDLVVPFGGDAELDLPVTDASTIEVDGRPFAGEPVGPGKHRVVVSAARVADPAALVVPALTGAAAIAGLCHARAHTMASVFPLALDDGSTYP